MDSVSFKATDSYLWKAISRSWMDMKCLENCEVGDSSLIDVWHDKWLGGLRFIDEVEEIPLHLEDLRVIDLVQTDGKWNMNIIRAYFPSHLINRVLSVPLSSRDAGSYFPRWPGRNVNGFSVSEAYKLMNGFGEMVAY